MDEFRVQAEASGAGETQARVLWPEARLGSMHRGGGGLYLRRNPLEQGEWLLECVKANYGRAGWGAQLKMGKSNGKFCGFVQDEALDRGEVESLKAKRAKPKAQRHGNNKKIPSFLED